LESECERVAAQLRETRSRARCLASRAAEKFREVWIANEEEAGALIREALEAERLIRVQQLGTPREEPLPRVAGDAGPPGGGRREKRDAPQVAAELLEGAARELPGI
ncbi:DRC1 protein, partial [Dasyornis broadbenti]|nr:DRC1 protein [Dasyornis broadbenti]